METSRVSDRVYEKVKAMAAAYHIRPDERVNEVDLARQLGVSRTPLREALNRLAAEGFLTATANRGYRVRKLDAQRVMALYEYRVAVEKSAARLACERATPEEVANLADFAARSRDEPEDTQAVQLLNLDEEFHLRLAALSHNDEFVRSIKAINERIRFVRWIAMRKGQRSDTQAEHIQIVSLIEKRDSESVVATVDRHISRRLDQIVEVIQNSYSEIYTGNALAAHLLREEQIEATVSARIQKDDQG